VLLLSQLAYIAQLFAADAERVNAAANVASYYILNNLFLLSFILLWVRNHFWGAEVIDAANMFTQSIVYWKNLDLPQVIHLPAIAGPYAWTVTALFWNGAVAAGGQNTAKRIVANIFIWAIFLFGQSHITRLNDYALGYALSVLMFCKLNLLRVIQYIGSFFSVADHVVNKDSAPLIICSTGTQAVQDQSLRSSVDLCLCNLWCFPRFVPLRAHDKVSQPRLLLQTP
jgi:hypothetical protein